MQNNWHNLDIGEIQKKFNVNLQGLSKKEAVLRYKKYGANDINQKSSVTPLKIFLKQFKSPLIYILLVVVIVTLFLQKYIDSAVVGAVVIINTLVGFIQELKAEKSLEAIKKLFTYKCLVIRENKETEIDAKELVIGDIVVINTGQKIPADIRLIKSDELSVDESIFTGESTTVRKNIEKLPTETTLADRKNMVYSSTIVSSGKGLGIVVTTGENTEIGKIAKQVATTKEEVSPLNKKMDSLGKVILYIVGLVCLMIFALGIWREQTAIEMFFTTVSAGVSAIPEGLPAMITIVLAIGVNRMVKRKALIRKMQAIETLGSINVIASDKTGTLTLNEMSLKKIYLSNTNIVDIDGEGYEPKGNFYINNKKIDFNKNIDLATLLKISTLCNDASVYLKENQWQIQGDPTEGSLLVTSQKAQINKDELNKNYPRIDEIQFSSDKGYMATLHKTSKGNLLAVKGKIEIILNMCSFYLSNGKKLKLTSQIKKEIEQKFIYEAKNAYRILGFAKFDNYSQKRIQENNISNLTYLGFTCLEDPPKKDAIVAIQKCLKSGIRPIMITGDHPETALAIAIKTHIAKKGDKILTGQEIEKLNEAQLLSVVKDVSVFARITPETKYKIAKALQKQGNIVGVTGDGVNDAPVLKKADVGIAMGIGGTDVAREASDIILLDNNFSTIIAAIEEGRTMFLNIRRIIFYFLSTNIGEVCILVTSLIINLPIPLIAVQILWINLITDITGAIALAVEPKHKKIEELNPKRLKAGFIDNISFVRMIIVSLTMTIGTLALYKFILNSGYELDKARTFAFITMILFQVFNVFNAQSMSSSLLKLKFLNNKYIIPMTIISVVLTILTTQTKFLQTLFRTQPLSLREWTMTILVASTIFIVVEIDKAIRNNYK